MIDQLIIRNFQLHYPEYSMSVLCCEQSKVGGTGGAGSFEEVLSSAAQASAQDTPTNNVTENSER